MAMRSRSAGRGGGAALLVALVTANASAQVNYPPNAAEDLYRSGLAEFQAGDYLHACPALAESYRLDPLPGALFTVATCELKAGKIASAFSRFGEFIHLADSLTPAQQLQQQTRRTVAEQQRRDLSVDLPYVRIALQGRSPSDTQIYLNGTLLLPESIGLELAVDPGEQVVEQRRGSRSLGIQRVVVAKGERKAVTVLLVEAPPVVAAVPVATVQRSANALHTLGYALAGTGVAGLALGSVTGLLALREKGIVHDECNGTKCSTRGKAAADSGKADGLVSTVSFGAGIAGLALGAALLLSPSRPASSVAHPRWPEVSIAPQRIIVTGVF